MLFTVGALAAVPGHHPGLVALRSASSMSQPRSLLGLPEDRGQHRCTQGLGLGCGEWTFKANGEACSPTSRNPWPEHSVQMADGHWVSCMGTIFWGYMSAVVGRQGASGLGSGAAGLRTTSVTPEYEKHNPRSNIQAAPACPQTKPARKI